MMTNQALTTMARSGYAARGVVYLLIGFMAFLAAIGGGGQTTDSKGALRELLSQPFGDILLGAVAVGLVGYAGWRLVQALFDADDHGTDAKGLAVRGGLLVSAVTHALLAFFAVSLIVGMGGGSGGEGGTSDWTAKLMSQPFGRWLVALVGVAVIGVGIAHAVKAFKEKFKDRMQMGRNTMRWFSPLAKFGLSARAVVFFIIGGFFILAAVQAQPEEARGLGGALRTLQQEAYGPYLLGVVALGLVAFGVYSLVQARYRQINRPT